MSGRLFTICKEININSKSTGRNVSVIQDIDGNNIVLINDIRFKGKRSINWKEVREYLKKIQNLLFLYMMIMVKWKGIIYFMPLC